MPPSLDDTCTAETLSARPDLDSLLADVPDRGLCATVFGHLVDIQFWLMGRDIEHPGGNLLCALGFTRMTSPERRLPTHYHHDGTATDAVVWPCGAYLAAPDSDVLMVRGQDPVGLTIANPAEIFDPAEVQARARTGEPCAAVELVASCDWFAWYEASIERAAGIGHRLPRPGSSPALAPSEPCSLEQAWRDLGATLAG